MRTLSSRPNKASVLRIVSLFALLLLISLNAYAQRRIILFSENFDANNCRLDCYADTYNGWTVTQVTPNGLYPNKWFVSSAENGGIAPGVCSERGGVSVNGTLHISADTAQYDYFNSLGIGNLFPCPTGDCGATYFTGTGLNGDFVTDLRAESPTINCVDYGCTIYLTFNYIERGSGISDSMTIDYSGDNGATWTVFAGPPKTDTCNTGDGEGVWAKYTVALPSGALNNPDVKIGFHWVNNDDGIGNNPSVAIDSVSVYSTNVPNIGFDEPAPQCAPGCFVLEPLVLDSNYDYVWTVNGVTPGIYAPPPYDSIHVCFPNEGAYTVLLSVSSASCGQTQTQKNLIVLNCTNPIASFSPTDTTLCAGEFVNFINRSIVKPGIAQYYWEFIGATPGSYNISSATPVNPPPVYFLFPGAFSVALMVIDVDGDTSSSLGTVIINACSNYLVAGFESVQNPICSGTCVQFNDQSSGNPAPDFWQWNFPGGTPSSYVGHYPPVICYYGSGQYDVGLIVGNTVSFDSLIIPSYINVLSSPQPHIYRSNDTLISTAGSTYQWYFNGRPISGASMETYKYSGEGVYAVEVRSAGGCAGWDSIQVFNAGINTTPINKLITISPNPNEGQFRVSFPASFIGGNLEVLNTLGERIDVPDKFNLNVSSALIDLSSQPAGIYFIRITNGTGVIMGKVFVNR